MNKSIKAGICFFLIALLASCASSGPATSYYTLFASDALPTETAELIRVDADGLASIGIGPVVLADYLKNSALVTRSQENTLILSGSHAWAENLDSALVRVLSAELSEGVDALAVQPFPWDVRARPRWQLRIDVQRFDGQRGGDAVAQFRWALFDINTNAELARGRFRHHEPSENNYASYVAALNRLTHAFSQALNQELKSLNLK